MNFENSPVLKHDEIIKNKEARSMTRSNNFKSDLFHYLLSVFDYLKTQVKDIIAKNID